MVIDSHSHWIPPTLMEILERRESAPRIGSHNGGRTIHFADDGTTYPLPDDLWNEDVKLELMDTHGIDLTVVSVVGGMSVVDLVDLSDAPAVARAANEELADLVRRHPGQFAALAALPMQSGQAAVDELERAVGDGLKGAMVYSNIAGRMLDEDEFMPVFAAAERLDVAIQIHPTAPVAKAGLGHGILVGGLGYLFDTTTAAMRLILRGVLEDLPGLKLHLCHAGSLVPQVLGRIDHFAATLIPSPAPRLTAPPSEYARKLYTDTVCLWPPGLRFAIDTFGPSQVMFGTDNPYWPMGPAFDTLRALDLPADELSQIQAGAATDFYRLETATATAHEQR